MANKFSKSHKPEDMLIRVIRVAEILAKNDCAPAQLPNRAKPSGLRNDEHMHKSQKHSHSELV